MPRYHWGVEGDAFGLIRETTTWPTKISGMRKLQQALSLLEKALWMVLKSSEVKIYWGAEPMVIAKYQFGDKKQYSFIASSETTDGPKWFTNEAVLFARRIRTV